MANVAITPAATAEDSGNGKMILLSIIAFLSLTGIVAGVYLVFRKPKVTSASVDAAVENKAAEPAKVSNEAPAVQSKQNTTTQSSNIPSQPYTAPTNTPTPSWDAPATVAPAAMPSADLMTYFTGISAGGSTKPNSSGKTYSIGDLVGVKGGAKVTRGEGSGANISWGATVINEKDRQFGVIVMVTANNNVVIKSNPDFMAPYYSTSADSLIKG